MRKSPKGKNTWADHYTRKAQKEGYAARSVYKLKEIQNKFTLIKKNDHVLDLGCAPGSWLLYASELTGDGGIVVGIDLKEVSLDGIKPHVKIFQADVLSPSEEVAKVLSNPFDVVLSDMAPDTTGNKFTDAARSTELSKAALETAKTVLKKNGSFVCKIFQGEDFEDFYKEIKYVFKISKLYKPDSTRKASKEIYIIGKELK